MKHEPRGRPHRETVGRAAEPGTVRHAAEREPIRVLHVINRLLMSGAETSLREILLTTQRQGLDHAIVVLAPDRNELDDVRAAGIPVHVPPRPLHSWLARVRHVMQAIDAEAPDLVHTTLFDADVAGRVAARLTRTPALSSLVNTPYDPLATPQGNVAKTKLWGVRQVDRFLSRHATTAFHAISQAAADAAVRDLGVELSRIFVVPRSRDLERLGAPSEERREDVRRRLGIDAVRPVVLNVARHERQKGLEYLVRGVAEVRNVVPSLLLLQAGREGNATSALSELVDQVGVSDQIRFLGFRDDVGDLLAAADVFVFPSLYEGLGGAVLEAMAMRVPIVASDIPALREVLDDGRSGVLVPPGDPAALADGIVRCLSDTEKNRSMVEVAAERFRTTYGQRACMEGMTRLYQQIAGRANTTAP